MAPPPAGDEAAAEVTSGLRRSVWDGILAPEEAGQALAAALAWAKRLGRKRAYDAFYVALAESRGAEFWGASRRPVNGLRHQRGPVDW